MQQRRAGSWLPARLPLWLAGGWWWLRRRMVAPLAVLLSSLAATANAQGPASFNCSEQPPAAYDPVVLKNSVRAPVRFAVDLHQAMLRFRRALCRSTLGAV